MPEVELSIRFDYEFPTRREFLDGTLVRLLARLESEFVPSTGGAASAGLPEAARIDMERVRVALREALANAAEHGNGFRPEARIRVHARADRELLALEVEDQGRGFDPDRVAAPRRRGGRSERGRGIRFMRAMADRVRFERGGSRVVLEWYRRRPA